MQHLLKSGKFNFNLIVNYYNRIKLKVKLSNSIKVFNIFVKFKLV